MICTRCGKEYDPDASASRIFFIMPENKKSGTATVNHVCEDCYTDYAMWLGSKDNKGKQDE